MAARLSWEQMAYIHLLKLQWLESEQSLTIAYNAANCT
jgi:hypothetical protein